MLQHRVKLSNGRFLLIEEGDECLHFASEQEGFEGEADYYICQIQPSGVLVMPNSGDAVNWLVQNLKPRRQETRTTEAAGAVKNCLRCGYPTVNSYHHDCCPDGADHVFPLHTAKEGG